ncbi:MAG TPA: AsmA-like C-terminal region-containing protein [Gammaproteobacteria bacterium]|nr:AsmA-like C-terminal region-containing protein [Gammaproteobacteria bacterium]
MIKSIISITFKIALSALTVLVLMFGAAMLGLSFGKPQIEDQLNQLVLENKLEIVEIVEKRLSLEYDYEELIVTYKSHSMNDLKMLFSFKDAQMAQTDDPLPVNIDEFNIEIDLIRSLINQIPVITAIVIDGSDIQFSHNDENGYMINNVPIKQFKLTKRKGLKRPSLELKAISAKAIDIEHLQETVGLSDVIESDDASFNLNLKWDEVPMKQEVLFAEGDIDLLIMDGVMNTKESVPGKALSIFSFSQLPKRFLLNFEDVLDEGLVFDYIKGNVLLKDRTAFTCNLSLSTKTIDVLIIGASDLEQRTYDQTMIVDPDVSDILTGGAAVLAGPAAAASMFLLSKILSRPEENQLSYFNLTGGWKKPEIESIQADDIDRLLVKDCDQFLPS